MVLLAESLASLFYNMAISNLNAYAPMVLNLAGTSLAVTPVPHTDTPPPTRCQYQADVLFDL